MGLLDGLKKDSHEKFQCKMDKYLKEAGWNTIIDYLYSPFITVDIVLFDNENRSVGAVAAEPEFNETVAAAHEGFAKKMIEEGFIEFFLLIVPDQVYICKGEGFTKIDTIPTPENYKAVINGTVNLF